MSWLFWLLTSLGGAGVLGLILLAIFAPPLFASITQGLIAIVRAILTTRIGCAVLAGLAAFYVGTIWQNKIDAAECAAKTAAFEERQEKRDEGIATKTAKLVRDQLAEDAKEQASQDQTAKEIKGGFKKSIDCRVGPDAARLRSLTGQAASADHRRVLKTRQAGSGAADRRGQ